MEIHLSEKGMHRLAHELVADLIEAEIIKVEDSVPVKEIIFEKIMGLVLVVKS